VINHGIFPIELVIMSDFLALTALILAGGQSSRMGRDKALLSFQGLSFLENICLIAQDCAVQVSVITPWPERYELIIPQCCRIIKEPLPTRGPLLAFALALTFVSTDWVLLLACDLPLLTPSIIQEWSRLLATVPENVIALVPRCGNRWEPLCAFYHRRCLASLQSYVKQGGTSFQKWLNVSVVEELIIDNSEILFNCNTPEDLEIIINFPDVDSKKP
jgi:molybdopterin-guanine dinucleotide biosynthesis protein A